MNRKLIYIIIVAISLFSLKMANAAVCSGDSWERDITFLYVVNQATSTLVVVSAPNYVGGGMQSSSGFTDVSFCNSNGCTATIGLDGGVSGELHACPDIGTTGTEGAVTFGLLNPDKSITGVATVAYSPGDQMTCTSNSALMNCTASVDSSENLVCHCVYSSSSNN